MGYDLHIHRRVNWSDSDSDNDIELSEWKSLCETDPTLELIDAATARNPATGEVIEIKRDGLARWNGEPTTWFDLNRGQITVSGAEVRIIAKACEIAAALSGRVQGDEDEFYREDGTHYYD